MLLKQIVHHLEKNRMAREKILVPKFKYEHLKTIENNKEPVKPDSVNDNKHLKKLNDKALDNSAKSELINDTPQTGSGYISRTIKNRTNSWCTCDTTTEKNIFLGLPTD